MVCNSNKCNHAYNKPQKQKQKQKHALTTSRLRLMYQASYLKSGFKFLFIRDLLSFIDFREYFVANNHCQEGILGIELC